MISRSSNRKKNNNNNNNIVKFECDRCFNDKIKCKFFNECCDYHFIVDFRTCYKRKKHGATG